jgi:4-diphosphocytidyl-2-C-methyl-D-erythritol kinase
LRAIVRADPALATKFVLAALAAKLGADVTVCLAQRPAIMRGIGNQLEYLPAITPFWIVLANPGVPLSTADVFRALGAPPVAETKASPAPTPAFADLDQLVAEMRRRGNDLQATGIRLCPPIADVLAALEATPGCLHAAQSGSGPTCFGVFANQAEAHAAANRLSAGHARWWVTAAPVAS